MKKEKAGRPRIGESHVGRDKILKSALKILDRGGIQELSMRKLAEKMNVTPMALYHHVGNRSQLLCALSDMVYGDVNVMDVEVC